LLEQRRRIDNLGRAVVLARRPSAMVCDATVVAVFDSYRFGCRITPGLSGFFR